MKKPLFKRVIAYFVDIMIITIISLAFSSISFLNPNSKKYNEASETYEKYVTELSQTNPTAMLNDPKAIDLSYDVSYYGVYNSLITIIVTFLYFCIFQYYTKGKTVGKLLCGLEVVSLDKKELKLSQVIIRSGIVDSILTSSILLIMVLFLSKGAFIKYSVIVQIIDSGLIFACIGMAVYRNDGIGLHDYLAKTRVILSKEKELFMEEK